MTTITDWGTHWHGLTDARVINTEPKLRTERIIASVVTHRGIVHIYGPAGSGKTFATARALAGVETPTVYALFDGQANPKEMASVLLREATGCAHDGTRATLRDECVNVFGTPTILVIDEVQHLQRDCMYFLRYLHDHPLTNVTIILVGGPESRMRVGGNSALSSRVRSCPFEPVKLDVLLAAIPKYHRIFRGIAPADIQRIYDLYAGGDLRRWAEFAITAIDECARRDERVLNSATITSVLAELVPEVA